MSNDINSKGLFSRCVHEAGHGVIAYRNGFNIKHIKVFLRPTNGAVGVATFNDILPETSSGNYRYVMFCLAGFIAELNYDDTKEIELLHGCNADLEDAKEFILKVKKNIFDFEFMQKILNNTEYMVKKHWNEILELSNELTKTRFIRKKRFIKIINDAYQKEMYSNPYDEHERRRESTYEF